MSDWWRLAFAGKGPYDPSRHNRHMLLTRGESTAMSLLTHICVAVGLAVVGVGLVITAAIINVRQLAWIGFAVGLIAHAAYLDCRARWHAATASANVLRAVS